MSAPQLPSDNRSPWAEPASTMSSERTLPERVDVCILGAGIAGLAVAERLRESDLSVAVLDARHPGAGTSGRSSAKVSTLHGHLAEKIASAHDMAAAVSYITANRHGFEWMQKVAAQLPESNWTTIDAVTYATDTSGERAIEREYECFQRAGVEARLETTEMPWGTHRALICPSQAQFDPQGFINGLTKRLREAGTTIMHPVRATAVSESRNSVEVTTDAGAIRAGFVVVATGLPILDRGLHFARTNPRTSHVIGLAVRGPELPGAYLSASDPLRSIRDARDPEGRRVVLVGGEEHRTGTISDTLSCQQELLDWSARHFDIVDVPYRFSAKDYLTPDHVPFAGPIHPASSRIHVITGLNKWGFTNAPAAAAIVSAHITDSASPDWSDLYSATRLPMAGFDELAKAGIQVARYATTDWVRSLVKDPRHPGQPLGGERQPGCAATGVCTHLGGIVRWNNAAETWDCPLHGSRFDTEGH
ncbi:MAG: FAD-dependent oxidoreductase, partial [Acidimicrobiales bacterium]|nr:FAD-dependent oxidoreductase [Acidimicrobiales bacterium]